MCAYTHVMGVGGWAIAKMYTGPVDCSFFRHKKDLCLLSECASSSVEFCVYFSIILAPVHFKII